MRIPLHGLNFKKFVALGSVPQADLSKALKITRQYLYNLYGEEEFKTEYIQLLNKAKIFVPGINAPGGLSLNNGEVQHLKERIKSLEEVVNVQRETIDYQKQLLAQRKPTGGGSGGSKRQSAQAALF